MQIYSGQILDGHTKYYYKAGVIDTPSSFCIANSCVLELIIRDLDAKADVALFTDNQWAIQTPNSRGVIDKILQMYG